MKFDTANTLFQLFDVIEAVTANLKVLTTYANKMFGTFHVQLASATQPTVIQNDSAQVSKHASGEGREGEHRASNTKNIESLVRLSQTGLIV